MMVVRLSFLFCTVYFLLVSYCRAKETPDAKQYDVIIVGAGVSGIAAATKLLKNDVKDILVLEARDRIGGRMHTTREDGHVMEMGAQFIHGKKNVVFDIVKDYDIWNVSSMYGGSGEFYLFGPERAKYTNITLVDLSKIILDSDISEKESYGNYAEYLVARLSTKLRELKFTDHEIQLITNLAEKLESDYLGMEPSETSMKTMVGDEHTEDEIVEIRTGYWTYLDILMGRYPDTSGDLGLMDRLLLNKEVTQVKWGDEGVEIACSDGSHYSAKQAILTLPLGVLKSLPPTFFQPILSPLKTEAIQSTLLGTLDPIYMVYDDSWWPAGISEVNFAMDKGAVDSYLSETDFGVWPTRMSGFYLSSSFPTIIKAYVNGKNAREMEPMSDEEVKEACWDMLQRIMGNETFTVPKPKLFKRGKWLTDPYSKGSYSNGIQIGKDSSLLGELEKPLLNSKQEPVVLFAGEHTSLDSAGTVHGATETGFREADRILGKSS